MEQKVVETEQGNGQVECHAGCSPEETQSAPTHPRNDLLPKCRDLRADIELSDPKLGQPSENSE
jgi:hypothetical protein